MCVCVCVSTSVSVSVSVSVFVSVSVSVLFGCTVCLFACLLVCLSVCLFVCLCVCLSVFCVCPVCPVCQSVCLSVCLFVCLWLPVLVAVLRTSWCLFSSQDRSIPFSSRCSPNLVVAHTALVCLLSWLPSHALIFLSRPPCAPSPGLVPAPNVATTTARRPGTTRDVWV